jgi:hypothetical protein
MRDQVEACHSIEAQWHRVALDAKALVRSVIEHDSPSAEVVTQPQHFAGARRQGTDLLTRKEWLDGQGERATEKVCSVGLIGLRHSPEGSVWFDNNTRL